MIAQERLSVEHVNYIGQLSGMANNLSQIARQANAKGYKTLQLNFNLWLNA